MAAPVIPPPITARSNSSSRILLRLIFLVFGEKFPLEDLGFSRSMLASQQLSGVIKRHGRPDIFLHLVVLLRTWSAGILA
jgi:hypothetical protein